MSIPDDASSHKPVGRHSDNRLDKASSPYLRQHAHHPVAWHPWDEYAIQKAQLEDKVIFLSIGYAACHWCHVMANESFEDPATSALMNQYFINIKVDREERPDIDELYMTAVTALTGRGGWPASIFLTPDLNPFYGGTYFPPTARYGMPSFTQVLEEIARLWDSDRSRILEQASGLTSSLKTLFTTLPAQENIEGSQLIQQAVAVLEADFDGKWGGWGSAPKFPSAASLLLLLGEWERNAVPHHLHMVKKTLVQMAAGGMYDHIGGGFHRYSVDGQWKVPHFEKMLYDNAHLALAYLEAWRATGKEAYKTVSEDILNYVLGRLQDPEGGFYSSEDADSEGLEGKYYLWSWKELASLLGDDDLAYVKNLFSLSGTGNFDSPEAGHQGLNIFFAADLAVHGDRRWLDIKKILLARRMTRVAPGLDNKVIASWNGLILSALAKAAFYFDNSRYREEAVKLGHFIQREMIRDNALYRIWNEGILSHPAYLEDYSAVVVGLIDLYQCSFEEDWLKLAATLGERLVQEFHDDKRGGFFNTGSSHKELFARLKTVHDSQEVSPGTTAMVALQKLAWYFDRADYRDLVQASWKQSATAALHAVRGHITMALVGELLHRGFTEVVFVEGKERNSDAPLLDEIRRGAHLNTLVAFLPDGSGTKSCLSFTHGTVEEKSTVHVCSNQQCLPPVTDIKELRRGLDNASVTHD
jgi:uncharacterized protein YyaL (SSP411 family)